MTSTCFFALNLVAPANVIQPRELIEVAWDIMLSNQDRKAFAESAKPIQKLRGELEEIRTSISKYLQAFEKGQVEMESIANRLRELKEQENRLVHEIDVRANMANLPKLAVETDDLRKIQEQLKEVFRKAP